MGRRSGRLRVHAVAAADGQQCHRIVCGAWGSWSLGDAEGDRRVKTVRFTPAGRRYCNSLIAPSRAAEYRAMSELPDELRSALLKGMGVYGRVFRKQMYDISV